MDDVQLVRAVKKGKEREHPHDSPVPTDFAERLVAHKRRTAAATRPKDRAERPPPRVVAEPPPLSPPRRLAPPHPSPPQLIVSRSDSQDVDDSLRRRKAQLSPRSGHARAQPVDRSRLFNPDADPMPIRRTAEPEAISDNGSSSYGPRASLQPRDPGSHGRLFDHRKDDPVRFNVLLARPPAKSDRPSPTPKSSGEYVSASSTSSYAHSITSSNFTLSSTTDGSSASSFSLFEKQHREESGNSAFAVQLKKLYRGISNLETRLLKEESPEVQDEGRVMLKKANEPTFEAEEAEKERWSKFIADHKQLAEDMYNLLKLTLAPHVPTSLRNIATKYNIIVRLWTYAFNKPLESLRRASFQSYIALEHLQDFIIYAYEFYSMLLEEQYLEHFRSGWLEGLGDLARYRMAITALTNPVGQSAGNGFMPISEQALSSRVDDGEPPSRAEESPGPSVGVAAARALELEPEKERWRSVAQGWYAAGLASTPGTGKLHHHLGLLSRDAEGEELRAIYHFVKSMTTLHPFMMSRESILPIWSVQAQSRRSLPDASVSDLFVLLHGMLFTNIQLDDFAPTLARFMERLQLEGAETREWIMMAVINITSVLEYGKPTGVLRKAGGLGSSTASKNAPAAEQAAAAHAKVTMMMTQMEVDDDGDDGEPENMHIDKTKTEDNDEPMDMKAGGIIDVSPAMSFQMPSSTVEADLPLTFKYALELTFTMFAFTLRNPMRKATPFARSSLNPYLTIILTFLATVLKHKPALPLLERSIPWDVLVAFLVKLPAPLFGRIDVDVGLTSKSTPLPEDWCLRGMEWGGRRLYERGFWRTGKERHMEMEVLSSIEEESATDGIIEDEDEDDESRGPGEVGEVGKRAVRIVRATVTMSNMVPGFEWERNTTNWRVSGVLKDKVLRWSEEEKQQREEEERRRSRQVWADESMDIDDEDNVDDEDFSEDSESDEEDSEEVKALKARRRELRRMLHPTQLRSSGSPQRRRRRLPRSHPSLSHGTSLRTIPGYTVLVIDTNILLSSLSIFASLVESLQWTIVIPLAVITELDGLASNASTLGENASAAITYITSHLRSHAVSLKVQTSKGNYLSTLTVRSEVVDFSNESWERSMDDLILRAAVWQDDHWIDRSNYLKVTEDRVTTGAAKVVLMSFDRNLRLKARARNLDAADEKDMAAILKHSS